MSLIDLADDLSIELVAIDASRNCRRHYRIERSRDLFGHQLIEIAWGRIGARPQVKRYSAPTEDKAITEVRKILARRATATVRIGASYQPVGQSARAPYPSSMKR